MGRWKTKWDNHTNTIYKPKLFTTSVVASKGSIHKEVVITIESCFKDLKWKQFKESLSLNQQLKTIWIWN